MARGIDLNPFLTNWQTPQAMAGAMPDIAAAQTLGGSGVLPRTPAEFWSQRLSTPEPAVPAANPDKRYGMPRFGPAARRARRAGDRRGLDGERQRSPDAAATPATPATPADTIAMPATPAIPSMIGRPPDVQQVRQPARRPASAFPTGTY